MKDEQTAQQCVYTPTSARNSTTKWNDNTSQWRDIECWSVKGFAKESGVSVLAGKQKRTQCVHGSE